MMRNHSERIENIEFVPISVCRYDLSEYDADGKNSVKVQSELMEIVNGTEPEGKLLLLKVAGEMSGGKTSDIDFQQMKRLLKQKGALEVFINYQKLTSKEYTDVKVAGEDIYQIEERLFKENIGTVKVSDPKLKGESGIKLSRDILNVLKHPRIENEAKNTYEERITTETIDGLRIREAFE